MRICASAGLLPVLLRLCLLTVLHIKADQDPPGERHYYIAAVEINWSYSGNDRFGPTYRKVVFREYEKDFRQAKTHPSWLGLLGPTLRAEEGETIVVTFRNLASEPYSIHPHGIAYGKQSEGANYFDNTSQKEKEDDVVRPNSEHVYYWEVTSDVSPQPSDPTCLTYSYISHRNVVQDYNSGLIGALLLCKPSSLDESQQVGVHQELVFLFGVFDEKEGKDKSSSHTSDNRPKYTINGYAQGSLPDVSVCAYSSVSLHLLGMSSEPELFSVHMNGQVLQQMGHKVSSVGLISGSSATASMVPLHTGRWMLSSHVTKHLEEGMHGFVDVKMCEGFKAPKRMMTIKEKHDSMEWTYYIAAEEVIWDYAPNMPEHIDEDFKFKYLRQSPTRIGRKYKKAVYTFYKNESFTERIETKQRKDELGILGPVIRAQIRDVIKIVFKNKASRPYSIYPHGLTIEKSEEGVNYPEGGNSTHGVNPGETHTYVWRVVDEDQPLHGDARCLTRMYHSAVNTPRDIASGLIGPILICKSQSLNVRNVQLKADKEQHAIFSVFDENKSWYLEDNIYHFTDPSKVNKADPDFYKSNVMNTINGYVFESGQVLGFCNGEIATWHVSSIGAQDHIQTVTFYGHAFELNGRTEDFLSLHPMTGETITMNMDNIGVWLLTSLSSHQTTKGMHLKFQDVECFRENHYEYDDNEPGEIQEFNLWKPPSMEDIKKEEIKKEEEKLTVVQETAGEIDIATQMFAEELGLRSRKNQSVELDVEQLDISFLDYDIVDVNEGIKNTSLNFRTKETKSITEVNGTNVTGVHLLNQILIDNGTLNTSVPMESVVLGNTSTETETTNLSLPLPDTSNVTATRLAILVSILKNLTRTSLGSVNNDEKPLRDPGNIASPACNRTLKEDVNKMATNHVNASADGTNHSLPLPAANVRWLNISCFDKQNLTMSPLKSAGNTTSVSDVPINATKLEYGGTENITQSNSSGNVSIENQSNYTSVNVFSNETIISGNLSVSRESQLENTSQELDTTDSREEVLIYLKENKTQVIKTTSLKTQEHNWTYEGTHKMVPMEIPDHMVKYIVEPKKKPKIKKVTFRQRPEKGQGLKTKKRKEYKPQVRSGLPFSPRGFNPGMTPRGSRPMSPQPVSDEEELINKPVVIGLPRPDFSDYELYIPGDEPQHLDMPDVKADEYEYVSYKDPYSSHEDIRNFNLDETTKYYLKHSGPNVRTYFIAAEEVEWDYAGYGQRRQEKLQQDTRETKFTKVVFRGYMDGFFRTPDVRGELDEHLGILGPLIKAEVGQSILVVFKNNANRPFSLHPNGVSYTKWTEGLSYEDGSKYWYKYDNEVQPNTTFTYIWKVPAKVGPSSDEADCRTWVYYSGVNPERDIHSGLIGPLLVCRAGTLKKKMTDTREFILLLMTFDESQSWYYERNREIMARKKRRRIMDPNFKDNLKFHSINGITYNLKGLRMYTDQLVSWHLINMGSPKDFQSVHFHGQTFLNKQTTSYRQAVFPLLPGSFATLEMYPSKPGLWQLESEIGFIQQRGMQTLFLVLDNDCYRPLGLELGSVKDDQITAINTRGYWEPKLARLNNGGKFNAWSTEQNYSWIQVDFERPVVISQVATQGAKQLFQSQFVQKFAISYSNDRRKWIFYKGDSKYLRKVFMGNQEAYETKTNTFFPPVVGRFIRLHPIEWYNKATVRMEFYGCELDGCSVPLGMESQLIEDHHISASSIATSWYSGPWKPSLARLNKQGTINAWQAKYSDMNQWLMVELPEVKKITGIITQGAKSLGTEMYVIAFTLQYSDDGLLWTQYTDDESRPFKMFTANADNNEHVRNYIYPPIFSRLVRIHPKRWMNSITMRVELLGCDLE